MDRSNQILLFIMLFILLIAFGSSGYMIIEGWKFMDALYMTIITIATVGYSEVNTISPWGRGFTILLILMGVGFFVYVTGNIIQFLVEGLANGQPVGGYWPQGHNGFSGGGYNSVFISWSTTQISFSIDDMLVGIYNMTLTSPSFSVMGCARMPGDTLQGILEIYDWSFLHTGLVDPPTYQMWTADNATGTITPIGIAQSPFGY